MLSWATPHLTEQREAPVFSKPQQQWSYITGTTLYEFPVAAMTKCNKLRAFSDTNHLSVLEIRSVKWISGGSSQGFGELVPSRSSRGESVPWLIQLLDAAGRQQWPHGSNLCLLSHRCLCSLTSCLLIIDIRIPQCWHEPTQISQGNLPMPRSLTLSYLQSPFNHGR